MNNEVYLNESLKTARNKFETIVPKEVFERFVKQDWSSTYKFIHKMCELYVDGYSEQSIISLFNHYKQYENYITTFDITSATFDDIKNTIECAIKNKMQSRSYIENKLKNKSLIYSNNDYRLYRIQNFSQMQYLAKSTPWCIGLNEEEYSMYSDNFYIFVFCDYSENEMAIYRKMCIMLSKNGLYDMIVTKDNIHHYSSNNEFTELLFTHIPQEIINLLEIKI